MSQAVSNSCTSYQRGFLSPHCRPIVFAFCEMVVKYSWVLEICVSWLLYSYISPTIQDMAIANNVFDVTVLNFSKDTFSLHLWIIGYFSFYFHFSERLRQSDRERGRHACMGKPTTPRRGVSYTKETLKTYRYQTHCKVVSRSSIAAKYHFAILKSKKVNRLINLEPTYRSARFRPCRQMVITMLLVTHGQCDVRPTVLG